MLPTQPAIAFLRAHLESRPIPTEKVMLLWDDFSASWTPAVTAYAAEIGVILKRVPAGYTWIAQPADIVWNHALKNQVRRRRVENLRKQVAENKPPDMFVLKAPTRIVLATSIQDAWSAIRASMTRNGFVKCGLVPLSVATTEEEEESFAFPDTVLLDEFVNFRVAEEVNGEHDFSMRTLPMTTRM
ncbi:hypothetical protein ACHHYP_07558 [Achlya hypogyna]|uniref:DDE-1 domain-containing protein n=1 Tax=Achlya hypogyna TaxID=1202772 RepID=A0A1V9YQS4_ACHHY|nr:hypothetical protein ACHHYP_07558 [Achlya hypogyna]